MLIPPAAWAALLESGVAVRPVSSFEIELGAADDSSSTVVAAVERRVAPLSPSHVRRLAHSAAEAMPGTALLLVVPAASPAALDAAAAAGISVLVADESSSAPVTGRIVLTDRTIRLDAPRFQPDGDRPSGRPGRRPWGALTVVRRLLADGPATQTDLAHDAAISQARVSQTMSRLAAAGLVEQIRIDGRPRWRPTDWNILVDWWMAHYPGPGGLTTYWYGLSHPTQQARAAVAALRAAEVRTAVSGDVAADVLAPWRRPGRAVLYADPHGRSPDEALEAAGLMPSGSEEATLELIVPADPGVWPAPGDWTQEADLPLVDALQVLWDVRRAPGSDVDQAIAALLPVLRNRAVTAVERR